MNQEKFFTNKDQQELLVEMQKELTSCDEVYLIYPFISKTILNRISASFDYCLEHNIPIKIISTTFDDLAQFNNLKELVKIVEKYPNIEIKIEDNLEKHSERIHIKASIFKRKNGSHSAIMGSSNLTYNGMVAGREWNVKILAKTPHDIVNQMIAEFDSLWEEDFVNFANLQERNFLLQRVQENQLSKIQLEDLEATNFVATRRYLFKFQKEIINKLSYRRFQNKNKHLIVMATGTGKTTVAAFDFKRLQENSSKKLRLLFLAHQKEIIDQAIMTYRQVLNDFKFGSVLYDGTYIKFSEKPQHLFATIQSLSNRLEFFDPKEFDVIVFDEAHHLAANSFDKVFKYFEPQEILGLTATPEREDLQDISKYFDNEFAYELRLWEAINQKLLCPFDYYCIDDTATDLQGVDLTSDRAIFQKINTESRNQLLFDVIEKYLGIYARPTCLIFCATVEHAKIVANYLKERSLKAEYLTSENNKDRIRILHEFKTGRINYLCVVNIFNEGIDVPEINTIILLRPTSSKTVYLQQLGRGLRKTSLKNRLEVYDLIANIDNKYDLTVGIKNLFEPGMKVSDFEKGKNFLPYDSTIRLEKQTEKLILESLKKWYHNKNQLQLDVINYYQQHQTDALNQMLKDYELSIYDFYNKLDDLFLKVAYQNKSRLPKQNQTKRNKNLVKQFLFLNNYQIINYFYLRLSKHLNANEIDFDYDNLLMTCFLYEITSLDKFLILYPNYLEISDLVSDFIDNHEMIIKEVLMILKYKIENENLIFETTRHKLLNAKSTYTVKQALAAIGRTNFLWYRQELKIITFQAGYLTFDLSKQIILADEDGNGYGKMTRYDAKNQKFYWSLPEKMTLNHKIIQDFETPAIVKYLFIHNKQNYHHPKLFLKLYDFVGEGKYLQMHQDIALTVEFDVVNFKFEKS
ncbi:DEAD/DEAH box helicase family protein [Mesoplasma seiffertii]|uniref:DEAD/DEAH box helicase family protein n=1 Tax=Mesoplasma seiffertii TaxID=28224 RepID=UPI00047DF349|nr:DEAD/DEAH box helicase family protein [Mesoplasma seiffertii]